MAESNHPDYLVGYKKPPRHTQFKPGRSGNASGRPKKIKTVTDAFRKQASKVVNAPIKGGGTIRASMLDLIAITHCSQAAKGDHRSAALVLRVLEPAETDRDNGLPELVQEFRSRNARHRSGSDERGAPKSDEPGIAERPQIDKQVGPSEDPE